MSTTFPLTSPTMGQLLDALSNVEAAAVLDGGSCRLAARDAAGDWTEVSVDLDGVWAHDADDPGYLWTLRGWTFDRTF